MATGPANATMVGKGTTAESGSNDTATTEGTMIKVSITITVILF